MLEPNVSSSILYGCSCDELSAIIDLINRAPHVLDENKDIQVIWANEITKMQHGIDGYQQYYERGKNVSDHK